MAQEWPTPTEIAAAVDRLGSDEIEAKPVDETTEAQTETAGEPVETEKPEETTEEQPEPDIAAIAQQAKEKGPRSPEVKDLISSLDQETLDKLGQALLPKLQSKLSTRSNELNQARQIIETLQATDSAAEKRHEEMMTLGMTPEDRAEYLAKRAQTKNAEAGQAVAARAANNARILGSLWQVVNAAGPFCWT